MTTATARKPAGPSRPDVGGWGVASEVESLDSGWVSQPTHQIVYAAAGVLHLEVADGQWLLPPQRAAWIRAGTRYKLESGKARLYTVHVDPSLADMPETACAVFQVDDLARAMIDRATKWGADRSPEDQPANHFFLALAALTAEWVAKAYPFRLPVAKSDELAMAMKYALDHLQEEPTIEAAADLAGVSPRTLARRFQDEADTTWRKFLHDARMMRAMELLADPGHSVTDTAYAVGFNSLGAFTRAFVEYTGERPRDYHRRVTDVPDDEDDGLGADE